MGDTVFDSNAALSTPMTTEVRVQRRVRDGWYIYTSDQLPGLYVAHTDDRVAREDVVPSIAALLELNLGGTVTVFHKIGYNDFMRPRLPGARGAMEERTKALIDSHDDQDFCFTLQRDFNVLGR